VLAIDQEVDLWILDLSRTTFTAPRSIPVLMYPGVDPRRPPADLQFGRGGRTKSLLAGADAPARFERLTAVPTSRTRPACRPTGPVDFHRLAPKTGEDVMQLELHGTHR